MPKKILLINWDCYPNNASGGVYTWTKILIETLSHWDFTVVHQLSNPNSSKTYTVPKNVSKVIEMPIFGTNRYEEFFNDGKSLIKKILNTTDTRIRHEFIPLFREFLSSITSERLDTKRISDSVYNLHEILTKYDAKKCLEHYLTWETFLEIVNNDQFYKQMRLKDAHTAFQLLRRNLQILAINVPKIDLIHCSLAWFPSLLAIVAKRKSNCPIIITEHGVAFRELFLYYNAYLPDIPTQIFWKVCAANIIKTLYSISDLITPVCNYNAIWEQRLGVPAKKIEVIYNGIDTKKFTPKEVQRSDNRPTVVCVARIEIYKDVVCLIQSINHVRKEIPDIKCLIYGASRDLDYSLKCVETIKQLQLEDYVKFMGVTNAPQDVYNMADVVAMSSITEGFPFSIIEPMACGKAVVTPNVGGVPEALEGCGILVRSRNPEDLANGIVMLLKDVNLRKKLAMLALEKARKEFTLEKSAEQFGKAYESLTNPADLNPQLKQELLLA